MLAPRHRHRTDDPARQHDVGIGSLELLGGVTVAVILATAVLVSVRALDYQGQASAALCRITEAFGLGTCESADVRDREDYLPPEQCVVTADGGSASVRGAVVLLGGANGDWLVEELGDDTFRMTRGAGLEVGATIGVGFDVSGTVDGHRYGAGPSAGASATLEINGGEVYNLGSMEEAKALLAAKNLDAVKDGLVGAGGVGRTTVDKLHGLFGDTSDEARVPDEEYIAGGVSAELAGSLNTGLANAGAAATLDQTLGVRTRPDGTRTVYLRGAGTLSGDLQGIEPTPVAGRGEYAELSGRLENELVIELDYDKDRNPTAMTVRSATVVDGTKEANHASRADFQDPDMLKELAVRLPLESTEDRRVAMRMLYAAGVPYAEGMNDSLDLQDVEDMATARFDPKDAFTEFSAAAQAQGQIWRQTTSRETSEHGVNFDAAYLAKLQVSAGVSTTYRELQHYEYWDGRQMSSRAGCGVSS